MFIISVVWLTNTANLQCGNSVVVFNTNNISLFDSTVVTKENLHLKKKIQNWKQYVELEWKFIFNEFFKCEMTCM